VSRDLACDGCRYQRRVASPRDSRFQTAAVRCSGQRFGKLRASRRRPVPEQCAARCARRARGSLASARISRIARGTGSSPASPASDEWTARRKQASSSCWTNSRVSSAPVPERGHWYDRLKTAVRDRHCGVRAPHQSSTPCARCHRWRIGPGPNEVLVLRDVARRTLIGAE
jgi:hypothetical protein